VKNWTLFGRDILKVYVEEARAKKVDSWQAFKALSVDELKIRQDQHRKQKKGD
jgi:hypothetical protein